MNRGVELLNWRTHCVYIYVCVCVFTERFACLANNSVKGKVSLVSILTSNAH